MNKNTSETSFVLLLCISLLCVFVQCKGQTSMNKSRLDAILLQTTDYVLHEKWTHTLSGSLPVLITCDSVFKGQNIYIAPIASNYQLNENRQADIRYTVKIIGPDQSIYISKDDIVLTNKEIHDKNLLQLSESVVSFCFNENDDWGTYKIQVEVTDKIAKETKMVESEMVLTQLPAYDSLLVKSMDQFVEWINTYYQSPKSKQALSYYIFYAKNNQDEDDARFWSAFSPFQEIVKNNAYLSSQIIDCYPSQDLQTRIYLLYLLVYANIEAPDFFEQLAPDEKEVYLELKDSPMIDIYGTIEEGFQLDMLWGNFFASGSYQPILKLIRTLDYAEYQGSLAEFDASKATEEDKQHAIYDAIYGALVWSLSSNCENHKLVSAYCNWAYQYEKLSDIQRSELKKILEK